MRHRTLSLAFAAVAMLALTSSAFAQAVTTETTTGTIPGPAVYDITGRTDQIFGFAQTSGVPAVAPGTFQPVVLPTDPTTAAQSLPITSYVNDLDAWMATTFGWRSSVPLTFMLFPDSESLIGALGALQGSDVSSDEAGLVLSRPSFLLDSATNGFNGVNPGEAVILVNMNAATAMQTWQNLQSQFSVESSTTGSLVPIPSATTQNAVQLIQQSMAKDMATLMQNQVADNTTSTFLKSGLADSISFGIVPGTPQESGRPMVVSAYQAANNLVPTVTTLDQDWTSLISTGGITSTVAQGTAFLSSNSLLTTVGPGTALEIMRSEANGRPIDVALAFYGGPTPAQLDTSTQSLIPIP